MKCVICRTGDTSAGLATVVLNRGEVTILVKRVPADICGNCGEYYLDEPITGKVMKLAEAAIQNGAELEIVRFAA